MRPSCRPMLFASVTSAGKAPAERVRVLVSDTGGQPASRTLPAGKVQVQVTNGSTRVLEWEDVMHVADKQNILPGFKATLNVVVNPGSFAMARGLVSNPKEGHRRGGFASLGPGRSDGPFGAGVAMQAARHGRDQGTGDLKHPPCPGREVG